MLPTYDIQVLCYSIAITVYKMRTTDSPAYLCHLIWHYHPEQTLQSADKLLLSVPRMALSLLAEAFGVGAPSVWNSIT